MGIMVPLTISEGRIVAPQRYPNPNTQTFEYATLYGKRDSVDIVMVRILRWKIYHGLGKSSLGANKGKRKAGESKSQKEL